ncbi:MAG: HAD hydrolase-like protein [Desulfovibrio sp.]|nr:HAD hydrolase-like protein [Desulfovibrio sp.]
MRPVFPFVLLDLDGTLTDSAPGILNAIEYALRHFHIDVPRSELNFMIGPPITEGFTRLLGGDRALAVKCVAVEREYYHDRGIFESSVFPGVHDMLRGLKEAGCRLGLATCKPRHSALRVLDHYDLAGYFDYADGLDPDGGAVMTKSAVVRRCLEKLGGSPGKALMAGDRADDIEGGHSAGMRAAGVLYGYGSREELSGAEYLCESPADIVRCAASVEGAGK